MSVRIHPWRQTGITLTATRDHPDPYGSVEVWADFTHDSGTVLRGPAFRDGGRDWRSRFASPLATGGWSRRTGRGRATSPGSSPRTRAGARPWSARARPMWGWSPGSSTVCRPPAWSPTGGRPSRRAG
ncbi:DUF5060 domain-containing protein [Streptomyces sp. NPDC087850]|uniref:DUF5060 domain-containing protein n=1 Tax=Streptomyces sp. NPDC087850 TaxID=3365809 RepID=UPI003820DFF7